MNGTEIAGWLKLLQTLGQALSPMVQAYTDARTLAKAAGVSEADLAAADARFARHYPDPLAAPVWPDTPDEPEPPVGAGKYLVIIDEYPRREDYPAGGDVWQDGEEARWMVTQRGVGIGKPSAPWRIVETF